MSVVTPSMPSTMTANTAGFARQDGRVLVRPFAAADAPLLYDAVDASIDVLSRWLSWCGPGYSRAEADAWIAHCHAAWAAGTEYPFGVFDSDGRLLGSVGLSRVDRAGRSADLGYWVAATQQGKGVATRAAAIAAAAAFEDFGLVRLEIVVLPDNGASRRVAEKLGATCEGLARNRLMHRGCPAPALVYSLVPGDLPQAQ